jgi:hypothetical protein
MQVPGSTGAKSAKLAKFFEFLMPDLRASASQGAF